LLSRFTTSSCRPVKSAGGVPEFWRQLTGGHSIREFATTGDKRTSAFPCCELIDR
jgi:hypothetical protein